MIDLGILRSKKHLGLGCSTFGGSSSKATSRRALEHACQQGIFYYDVARSYGYGQAEGIVGEFAKDKRESIVLASKFGILPPRRLPFQSLLTSAFRAARTLLPRAQGAIKSLSARSLQRTHFTPQLAVQSLETSLRELKTEYLDIYLLHECDFEDVRRDEMREALENERKKGKLRAWGGTFSDRTSVRQVLEHGGLVDVVQMPFLFGEELPLDPVNDPLPVLYSVLRHAKSLNQGERLLPRSLEAVPELAALRNFAEVLLTLAWNDLSSGVVLLSMTKPAHIDRNVSLCRQQHELSPEQRAELRQHLSRAWHDSQKVVG